MKAWRPWLTMVIKQRKIEREIAATEMSRVVRGFLGKEVSCPAMFSLLVQLNTRPFSPSSFITHTTITSGRVRAHRVRVHKATVVIQCRGRQYNARLKVQRQRVHRAALRIAYLFSKLLKIKRAKQEVQRRRRNRAVTRIQVSNSDFSITPFEYVSFVYTILLTRYFSINPPSIDTETVPWRRWPCPFCRMQSGRNGTNRERAYSTRASATGRNGTRSEVSRIATTETGGAGEGVGRRQSQERRGPGGQKRKRARGSTTEETRERCGSCGG